MPRLQLKELPAYRFRTLIAVRTTDLNYGGHLGNDKLLALVHEARVAFLASFGLSELDCAGAQLIMGDAAAVYRGEAFAGDDLLFEAEAGEIGRAGFRLFFRVTRPVDGAEIALVENGMITYDYGAGRVRPLPAAAAAALEGRDGG